jgi:hypothetical protein
MASDDGRLLLYAVLGFGGGIYTFFKGFRQYREYRIVADTPATHIRGISMGLVQVRGQAVGEQILTSPLTRTPCYLYRVVIEEWRTGSDNNGEWKHYATDIQSTPFYLQDPSGNVLIDAAGAELDLSSGSTRKLDNRRVGPLPPGAAVDADIFQYIAQAKVRRFTQALERGIAQPGSEGSLAPQRSRSSLLGFLMDPGAALGGVLQRQILQTMVARRGAVEEIRGLAQEAGRHPKGSAEYKAAVERLDQAYAGAMGRKNLHAPEPAIVLAFIERHSTALMAATGAPPSNSNSGGGTNPASQVGPADAQQAVARAIQGAVQAAYGHFRLTEHCVIPGQTYDVTGTCAENPHARDDYDRNIILKGTHEPTFLISSNIGEQLESSLRKRAVWMVLGGAGLAVVCLAIVLGKLGLLF